MDKLFKIEVLNASPSPEVVIYAAMHQDYSSTPILEEPDQIISGCDRIKAGKVIVRKLLAGNRGHYGPLEHVNIVLSCSYFPHSLIQQIRTHRVGISFDVQSFRYTEDSLLKASTTKTPDDLEKAFYLRPAGQYADRNGGIFNYGLTSRQRDLDFAMKCVERYSHLIALGMPAEMARGQMLFDYRQHFVLSVNARSLMHLLDLRWKMNAQIECQWFCDLLYEKFNHWMPRVAEWYKINRAKRARLSP